MPLSIHPKPGFAFADATGEPGLASPIMDISTPIYLAHGEHPWAGETFVHQANVWRARAILEVGDPLNPLNLPLIIAELV